MNDNNSLTIFTRASLMLAEADTIQKLKELKSLALTAEDWSRRKNMGVDAIQHCRSYALEAERKMGEMLLAGKDAGEVAEKGRPRNVPTGDIIPATCKDLHLKRKESASAQIMASIPRSEFDKLKTGAITRADVKRDLKRKEVIRNLESISVQKAKAISGVYDVIVVDPPWPMEKVERECRPNQVSSLSYPVMELAEIGDMKIPAAKDCHLFLWSTHRFLPSAFPILQHWGFKYCCAFVWHKPGGFQVAGLPQFNCEFALYARRGSPQFISTKAFSTCFDAPRGGHSEKPSEFYDLVRRVTAGRRLDMFSRRNIEGFDAWGKEAK